jgi:hypothetical protein
MLLCRQHVGTYIGRYTTGGRERHYSVQLAHFHKPDDVIVRHSSIAERICRAHSSICSHSARFPQNLDRISYLRRRCRVCYIFVHAKTCRLQHAAGDRLCAVLIHQFRCQQYFSLSYHSYCDQTV